MTWAAVIPVVGKLIERLFPDPEKAQEAKLKLFELQQQGALAELDADLKLALGQISVNKEEARTGKLFIAGWRPFTGWVCGISVAWHFIMAPTVSWFGVEVPNLDLTQMIGLLFGMLGIGTMRSFDKRARVDTQEIH